jgi:hypothetical protein
MKRECFLCPLRKQRVNKEIAKLRLECQRLLKNYRRNRNLQHQLISSILLIINSSISFTGRSIWSLKKSKKWWTDIQGRTETLEVGGASMNYSLNFHDYLNKISKSGGVP